MSDPKNNLEANKTPVVIPEVKLLTPNALMDPQLSDKEISAVFYRGRHEELKHLRHNPKLVGHDERVWDYVTKDAEVFATPWYPIGVMFIIMSLNLAFHVYQQFYSLILALFGLLYITYGIPALNELKEYERVKYLDKILLGSPYDKNLFIVVEEE